MILIKEPKFYHVNGKIKKQFLETSTVVKTEKWQGVDVSNRPEMQTHELLNVVVEYPINITDLDYFRREVQPNLPWADDHFEERVCGIPLNPGKQWANWPWASSADKFRKEGVALCTQIPDEEKRFNHTYMERYWGRSLTGGGDMSDLIALLAKEPLTRQAWIPIFWPQDTGIGDGGRKPCSLGYQVIVRNERAHIYYPLRSCDYVRHFPDDVYLTIRLLLWIIDECKKLNGYWNKVRPGTLTMHMTSLHIFENDFITLSEEKPYGSRSKVSSQGFQK